MQGYNCIAVLDKDAGSWLMCKRRKEPYKGLLNLVGGKIEENEEHISAAYRELWEETGITKDSIKLFHLLDFNYPLDDCFVEVYAGRLKTDIEVFGDENELIWVSLNEDFFDCQRFAGEGNIGHMLMHIYLHKDLFDI